MQKYETRPTFIVTLGKNPFFPQMLTNHMYSIGVQVRDLKM
jgi:hypothetical protein